MSERTPRLPYLENLLSLSLSLPEGDAAASEPDGEALIVMLTFSFHSLSVFVMMHFLSKMEALV